jgi:hypothetical protein
MSRYFPEIQESKTEFFTQLRQNSTVHMGHPKALVTINHYSGTFREIFERFKQINIQLLANISKELQGLDPVRGP